MFGDHVVLCCTTVRVYAQLSGNVLADKSQTVTTLHWFCCFPTGIQTGLSSVR